MPKLLKTLLAGCALLMLCTGCGIFSKPTFYDDQANWTLCQNDTPVFFADYDAFYLPPSQFQGGVSGFTDWSQAALAGGLLHYVNRTVHEAYGPHVRVFSPQVPLMGHDAYRRLLAKNAEAIAAGTFDFSLTQLENAIQYTEVALKHYIERYNKDKHPFILIGHEQGAVILYEAMKRCQDVRPANGFVIAYFQGLPGMTLERIAQDFKKRNTVAALGRYDINAIAVTNTRLPDQPVDETYGRPGGYSINPLNWRTDSTPATPEQNVGFRPFYTKLPPYMAGSLHCGATADPETGTLLLSDLPQTPQIEFREDAFHSDAWCLFSANLRDNAAERVQKFLFMRKELDIIKKQLEVMKRQAKKQQKEALKKQKEEEKQRKKAEKLQKEEEERQRKEAEKLQKEEAEKQRKEAEKLQKEEAEKQQEP